MLSAAAAAAAVATMGSSCSAPPGKRGTWSIYTQANACMLVLLSLPLVCSLAAWCTSILVLLLQQLFRKWATFGC
jgi:hypothetical protein